MRFLQPPTRPTAKAIAHPPDLVDLLDKMANGFHNLRIGRRSKEELE
jgi:hypothetical protein